MNINGCDVTITDVEQGKSYRYFACTCADEDDKFWEKQVSELTKGYIDPCSCLVMALEHICEVAVDGIGCDLWFGISLSGGFGKMYIQCDKLSHGFAAAILIMKEINPEIAEEFDS